MRSTFLLLLLLANAAFAANPSPPPPSDAAEHRVQSLYTEAVHIIRLRDVSLQEAFDELRIEWEKNHPNEAFPVAITDRRAVGPPPPYDRIERITVDFVDTTYIEALQELANLTRRKLRAWGGVVQFEPADGAIVEDYWTREYSVSPELLAALGLKPDSDSAAIRSALDRYGLEFDQHVRFAYIPSRQILIAMCLHHQLEQIAGILFLLGKGFHITK